MGEKVLRLKRARNERLGLTALGFQNGCLVQHNFTNADEDKIQLLHRGFGEEEDERMRKRWQA